VVCASSSGGPASSARSPAPRPLDEVERRLAAGEPFHLATLLRGELVDRFPRDRDAHLALPTDRQRALLQEALVAGGSPDAVAAALVAVPRHRLVPDELRRRAYLDEYHQAKSGSGLTPQSLVAAMLARLRVAPGASVLELGVGSGFHALAVLELGAASVTGVEADGEVLETARRRLRDLPRAAQLRLVHGAAASVVGAAAPFDRVYATFAYTRPVAALLDVMREGALLQVPRPVLPTEYWREPLLARERERYGSFESFFDDWQRNLCLTTYRREGGSLRVVDKMFGVRFVAQREEPLPPPPRATGGAGGLVA
jgi:protein-L-isoaspartate(D-aspartate) O-methyltransferase